MVQFTGVFSMTDLLQRCPVCSDKPSYSAHPLSFASPIWDRLSCGHSSSLPSRIERIRLISHFPEATQKVRKAPIRQEILPLHYSGRM